MASVDTTLVTLLSGAGTVYALEKPIDKPFPCIVYKRISKSELLGHKVKTGLFVERIQVTCLAKSYSELRTLVAVVETLLVANTTNFQVSVPTEAQPEYKVDDVYHSVRDYIIFYS